VGVGSGDRSATRSVGNPWEKPEVGCAAQAYSGVKRLEGGASDDGGRL